jgi:GAF domain-containing protein
MSTIDYSRFTQTLAAKGQTPQTIFAALEALTEAMVGVKLFTIMTYDAALGLSQRIYSNMPTEYPVSGTKPTNVTHWSTIVLEDKQIFVANTIEDIAAVFYDHELIQSLGCESVINVPIVINGAVLGTLNCLHEAGYYTPDRVAAAEALTLPGAAALLFNQINGAL